MKVSKPAISVVDYVLPRKGLSDIVNQLLKCRMSQKGLNVWQRWNKKYVAESKADLRSEFSLSGKTIYVFVCLFVCMTPAS